MSKGIKNLVNSPDGIVLSGVFKGGTDCIVFVRFQRTAPPPSRQISGAEFFASDGYTVSPPYSEWIKQTSADAGVKLMYLPHTHLT